MDPSGDAPRRFVGQQGQDELGRRRVRYEQKPRQDALGSEHAVPGLLREAESGHTHI